jgi:hypothetical protein
MEITLIELMLVLLIFAVFGMFDKRHKISSAEFLIFVMVALLFNFMVRYTPYLRDFINSSDLLLVLWILFIPIGMIIYAMVYVWEKKKYHLYLSKQKESRLKLYNYLIIILAVVGWIIVFMFNIESVTYIYFAVIIASLIYYHFYLIKKR